MNPRMARYLGVNTTAGYGTVRFQSRETYGWVFPAVMSRTYQLAFVAVPEFQVQASLPGSSVPPFYLLPSPLHHVLHCACLERVFCSCTHFRVDDSVAALSPVLVNRCLYFAHVSDVTRACTCQKYRPCASSSASRSTCGPLRACCCNLTSPTLAGTIRPPSLFPMEPCRYAHCQSLLPVVYPFLLSQVCCVTVYACGVCWPCGDSLTSPCSPIDRWLPRTPSVPVPLVCWTLSWQPRAGTRHGPWP